MKKSLSLFIVLAAFAQIASADQTKKARANDLVDSYTLTNDGRLFRTMSSGAKCDVTTGVEDFKISQHPNDAAMIYYIKDRALYYLKNIKGAERGKSCPSANKQKLISDVKRQDGKFQYHVVSNTNTDLVNTALSSSGKFYAWPNSGSPVTFSGVESYKLNACYGAQGKSFNTYMVFLRKNNGSIAKVKGNANNKGLIEVKTDDSQFYGSVSEFTSRNNVCNQ